MGQTGCIPLVDVADSLDCGVRASDNGQKIVAEFVRLPPGQKPITREVAGVLGVAQSHSPKGLIGQDDIGFHSPCIGLGVSPGAEGLKPGLADRRLTAVRKSVSMVIIARPVLPGQRASLAALDGFQ
jgi:hypothetical protein